MEISRIERIYRHLGLNQKQFAEKLGFSPKMIKNYSTGFPISGKFIAAMEDVFPEININYIRNREDNMLVSDGLNEPADTYQDCSSCQEKEKIIHTLENRLSDKEKLILLLEDKVDQYKQRLGECEDLSKQA